MYNNSSIAKDGRQLADGYERLRSTEGTWLWELWKSETSQKEGQLNSICTENCAA